MLAFAMILLHKDMVKAITIMQTEKRSCSRTIFSKTICFELNLMESGEHRNLYYDGYGVDISQDGLGLITDYYLKKGEVLKILIPTRIANITPVEFAEVVWLRQNEYKFRTGLRFLKQQ